jgi:Flagellar transcriptional activator (FlhC)
LVNSSYQAKVGRSMISGTYSATTGPQYSAKRLDYRQNEVRRLKALAGDEIMDIHRKDDSVMRELRGFELARRLIFHEVRTEAISQLTGLSRNRLATLRRRLLVSKDSRPRGPMPRSLDVFLRTARGRTEAAALAALFPLFIDPDSIKSSTSLDAGEQACDIYDAYLAYYPQSNVRFEELMLLKSSLAQGDIVALGLCRLCRGLIINHRFERPRQTCSHCGEPREHERTRESLIENKTDLR